MEMNKLHNCEYSIISKFTIFMNLNNFHILILQNNMRNILYLYIIMLYFTQNLY